MKSLGGDVPGKRTAREKSLVRVPLARYVIVSAMLGEGAWLDSERRRLVRLCASITGDQAVAEDLAQETLLEAWRHRHKLREPSGADRWLSAIARNVCYRWARRRGRDSVLVGDLDAELPDCTGDDLGHDELDEELERALARLSGATRDMVVLHYVHGLPHAEIAVRHGLSEEAVSMRISRVVRCFARCSTRIPATRGARRESGVRGAAPAGCRCAATRTPSSLAALGARRRLRRTISVTRPSLGLSAISSGPRRS